MLPNLPKILLLIWTVIPQMLCNPAAKRLYDDLLKYSGYNRLVRPVGNNTDTLVVYLGLKLGQLIDIDEKNQIMTTNVWLLQRWYDYQLKWDPAKYGNVKIMYVPAEEIWLPDIVLYNNADGDYVITIMNKAKVTYDGKVEWEPPAIFKSYCGINVEFFPFDEQECLMKFGSWSHHGNAVTLKHIMQASKKEIDRDARQKDIQWGMDLDGFEQSSEWDVLAVPAQRKEKFYTCCTEPFPDVTFNITIRRKPLFYTVNLIVPCTAISSLTIFVFYLPSGSKEKVGLGIYTLVSLTVFFLVLVDINPPTSFVVPLMGKYLLFTMILIVVSIFITVVVVSDHFRSPSWCTMPSWVREVFINILPKLLLMERPLKYTQKKPKSAPSTPTTRVRGIYDPVYEAQQQGSDILYRDEVNFTYGGGTSSDQYTAPGDSPSHYLDPGCEEFEHPRVKQMLDEISELAEHTREEDINTELKEDWAYVAMVLDRALFWLFSGSWIVGTFGILLQAPMIYDNRTPLVARDDAVDWCGEFTCVYSERYDYDFYNAGAYEY